MKNKNNLHSTEATAAMKPFELSPCILYFLPAMLLHHTLHRIFLFEVPIPSTKQCMPTCDPLSHIYTCMVDFVLRTLFIYVYNIHTAIIHECSKFSHTGTMYQCLVLSDVIRLCTDVGS